VTQDVGSDITMVTESDQLARIRPGRTIAGVSAVLLVFTADDEIDWIATEEHIARTVLQE